MAAVLIIRNVSATLRKAMITKSHIVAGKVRLFLSAIFAAVASALIMYVSWQHNPQCEIHREGVVHWGYWFS